MCRRREEFFRTSDNIGFASADIKWLASQPEERTALTLHDTKGGEAPSSALCLSSIAVAPYQLTEERRSDGADALRGGACRGARTFGIRWGMLVFMGPWRGAWRGARGMMRVMAAWKRGMLRGTEREAPA